MSKNQSDNFVFDKSSQKLETDCHVNNIAEPESVRREFFEFSLGQSQVQSILPRPSLQYRVKIKFTFNIQSEPTFPSSSGEVAVMSPLQTPTSSGGAEFLTRFFRTRIRCRHSLGNSRLLRF